MPVISCLYFKRVSSHLSNGATFPHSLLRVSLSENPKTSPLFPYFFFSPLQVLVHQGTTSLKSIRIKHVEALTPPLPKCIQEMLTPLPKRAGKPTPLRLSFTVLFTLRTLFGLLLVPFHSLLFVPFLLFCGRRPVTKSHP